MTNNIKHCYADKEARQPQKQHVEVSWRQPDATEKEYIILHWSPFFKAQYSPKLSIFFATFFLIGGLLFSGIALVGIFTNIVLTIILGLIAAGFFGLAHVGFKSNAQSKQNYNNILNGHFSVFVGKAKNLDLISFTPGISHTLEEFAYVDMYSMEDILMVQNVEIPFTLGKVLNEREYNEFPCLLIRLDGRKELIALPKFR